MWHTFITTCRHGRGRKTLPFSFAGCMKKWRMLDNLLDLALHQSVNLDPVACSEHIFLKRFRIHCAMAVLEQTLKEIAETLK